MKVRVLGSGAGGGLPQWNCNCKNCKNCRLGLIQKRSQSSLAITIDNNKWILINSSPEFTSQINNLLKDYNHETDIRSKMINDVILIDSQLDHITGLLSMRENRTLNLYCNENTYDEIYNKFNILEILSYYLNIKHTLINENQSFKVDSIPEIEFTPIYLDSKPPPFSENREKPIKGNNIGLIIKEIKNEDYIFYAPGISKIDSNIANIIKKSKFSLIDGTFWNNEELINMQISNKDSKSMGHIPNLKLIEIVNNYKLFDKIYLIHINNTNPILDLNSEEYKKVINSKIKISYDNLEIII